MKRFISFMLAVAMILGVLPVNEIAYAADEAKVTEVEVTKTYSAPQKLQIIYIRVRGDNLGNLGKNPVIAVDKTGKPVALSTIEESKKLLYYKIEGIEGVSRISVDGEDYEIGGGEIPAVTHIDPSSGIVTNGKTLDINGGNFKNFDDSAEGTINLKNSASQAVNSIMTIADSKITATIPASGSGGSYTLELKHETAKTVDKGKLVLIDNYVDLFTVHGELGVKGDIKIIPNQGPTGTTVKIIGDQLLKPEHMSVFFLKATDGTDPYTKLNMGTGETYSQDAEEDNTGNKTLDVFTVKVPKALKQGRYYVVLTNNVNEGVDPTGKITEVKQLDDMFTVVDNNDTLSIIDVSPRGGPESGEDVTIQGKYIGTMSPNVFAPNDGINLESTISPTSTTLKATYGDDNTRQIGKYKLIGGRDGVDVNKITREITVYIGGEATFRKGSSFTKDSDKLEIRTPSVNIPEGEDRRKEVTIRVDTIVKYGTNEELTITEEGTWTGGKFEFQPINYKPKIDAITPDKIPVKANDEIIDGLELHISGENFFKHRYTDKDGKVKIKYPVIYLGNQAILDPNISTKDGIRIPISSDDIKIYDKSGKEIDGTATNNLGNKISIKIPSGINVKNVLNQISTLTVKNPIKNDEDIDPTSPEDHLGLSAQGDIRFVKIGSEKTPIITSVDPNIVTTDGKETITIKGSNFGEGISVYLDGEKIKDSKRNGTGTEITFTSIPKPEGIYQIIVQNDEGGIATFDDFVYVKTYTNIKLTDFVPKKGTANAIVTVSGENFVRPNPAVRDLSGTGIYKLIGTRVYLGKDDINSYKGEKGIPALESYDLPKDKNGNQMDILKVEDNNVKGSDYYHSVVLQSGSQYFTIYFDTFSGKYKLTNGDNEEYTIAIGTGNELIGQMGGSDYKITIEEKKLVIEDKNNVKKELIYKTLYKVEDGIITGNRVKVINGKELVFTVPKMPREGYYDLTVINPDTKKDTKKDKSGFYYSFQPEYNPIIDEINPKEGSTEGGYFVDIHGEGFLDRGGDAKTSVTIGTVKIDAKDVVVSPDGNKITVKVPKYPGNLENETNMDRKTVAVVVTNPDGGTASELEGFTYIIPISHPKITKLILNEGSAAGGESVIIEGSEYRYFEPFKDTNNNGKKDDDESFTNINKNKDASGKEIWDDFRYWNPPDSQSTYEDRMSEVNSESDPEAKRAKYDELIKPILPKVYFGSEEATIISFTASTIEVETPKGQDGAVDVYLVNNDYGTSNKLKYTYKASKPVIKTIVPNVGRKQGNDKVEILGEKFYNSRLTVIKDKSNTEIKNMPLVQFGDFEKDTNVSNKSVPIDAIKNSGRIRDKKATVEVENLKVDYDASGSNRNLSFKITTGMGEKKIEYSFLYENYKDNEIFFPTSLLKDKDGNSYSKNNIVPEYVRVKLEIIKGASSTTRLRIDRGFSPDAVLLNIGQISLKTPVYYTVGKTKITIINPDNGTANGDFEYKNPDSSPTITDILKDGETGKIDNYKDDAGNTKQRKIVRVNVDGGDNISVLGTDFRKPVKIKIADIPEIATGIEYDPSNEAISQKMIFTMPKVDAKYVNEIHRIVIENEDGGTAGSDDAKPYPIYIQFIKGETTGLQITEVNPKAGTTKGGTKVTITGKDFRKKMQGFDGEELKLYIGDGKNQIRVPSANIDWNNTNISKIVFTTPPHAAGKVSIKVVNPDGSNATLKDAFTYVSNPKITKVVDPDNNDVPIITISVEGGQTIKIQGSDFMSGAKVIFNPVLKKASENANASGEKISIDGVDYILESGTPGTDVEFIDSANIKVKTPSGKVETGGVIVINPDGAGTPEYELVYGIPEITHPQDVRATLIKDEYIRINWNKVTDKATQADGKTVQYEVYVIEDGKSREYIGSTGTTGFVFRDIKPKTKYEFLVRAIGKYGSSKPINESISNIVRTGNTAGPSDPDGGLGDKTTIDKSGNTGNIVIGNKEFDGRYELVIDLTKGVLSGSTEVVVSIPADVIINGYNKQIKIIGSNYTLNFSPNVFMNSKIGSNRGRSDAGVKFSVRPVNKSFDLANNNGGTVVSAQYLLDGKVFIGSSSDNIENLSGNMKLTMDYDVQMVEMRKLKDMRLVKYDEYNRKFKTIYGNSGYGTTSGDINELGTYTIVGSRR